MKRTCLLSTAAILATLATSSVAHAVPKPAVVYIPVGDVVLTPSGMVDTACEKASMSTDAPAAGCIAAVSVDGETTATPNAMTQGMVDQLRTSLAAYDIMVTTEQPAPYLPVYGVLTSEDASEEGTTYTCSSAGLSCASRGRNSWAFTNTGTTNCEDPDLAQSALYAVGRLAGLEGSTDATDAMFYPPDYTAPVYDFIDACSDIAPRLGGEDGMTEQPLECTSIEYSAFCPAPGDDQPAQQNSHASLLDFFGPAAADGDAPVINVSSPADGDVIGIMDALQVVASFDEASNYVGMRITIASPALEGAQTANEFTFCTSDICDGNLLDADPLKAADTEWASSSLSGLPGGEYTITVEASDYYGNEAEPVVMVVTVEGGAVDPTEGDTDDSGDPTDPTGASDTNDTFVSGGDESSGGGSDTDGGGDGGASDDGGGCSVGGDGVGGSFAMMLGLLGLGLLRRRD